ncbi:MAG: 2-oxoacid:acceptor oxidoreductase family protein [Candidatus Aminicenantes bacterium]|nr:2-oxoacid:acceptor oxidoreductase family protein [Candidatus Aminicenantes bacterium]
MKHFEIRYGAVGGQGIITAGALLVDIAVEREGKFAIESPTYTAAVRGGPTKVDVLIADEQIVFPHATAIDFFLCTDQRPYDIYRDSLKDDAIVIVDSHLVRELGDTRHWKVYPVPIINETKVGAGNVVLTSVVSLAITQKMTDVISYENMVEHIKHWAPKGTIEMNMKAIEVGMNLIK